MEFKTHRDKDGFLNGKNVVVHGAREPGTLVTWIPRVDGMLPRQGVIVGVHSDQTDIAWNPWEEDRERALSFKETHERLKVLTQWATDTGTTVILSRQQVLDLDKDRTLERPPPLPGGNSLPYVPDTVIRFTVMKNRKQA